jgi:hypothetical protein
VCVPFSSRKTTSFLFFLTVIVVLKMEFGTGGTTCNAPAPECNGPGTHLLHLPIDLVFYGTPWIQGIPPNPYPQWVIANFAHGNPQNPTMIIDLFHVQQRILTAWTG